MSSPPDSKQKSKPVNSDKNDTKDNLQPGQKPLSPAHNAKSGQNLKNFLQAMKSEQAKARTQPPSSTRIPTKTLPNFTIRQSRSSIASVLGRKPKRRTSKWRRERIQQAKIPTTRFFSAYHKLDFLGTNFCKRFLRNLSLVLALQYFFFAAISGLILVNKDAFRFVFDNTKTILITHAISYIIMVVFVKFATNLLEKRFIFSVIPFIIVTCNIGSFFGLLAFYYRFFEIPVATGLIGVYFLVMWISQFKFEWELSLPSAIFVIVLANTFVGSGINFGLFYVSSYRILFGHYILTYVSICVISTWLLYEVEMMTTHAGLHKLLQYKVNYEKNILHAALHVSTDFLDMIYTSLKLAFLCRIYSSGKCPGFRLRNYIPRSGKGVRFGTWKGVASDSEED